MTLAACDAVTGQLECMPSLVGQTCTKMPPEEPAEALSCTYFVPSAAVWTASPPQRLELGAVKASMISEEAGKEGGEGGKEAF